MHDDDHIVRRRIAGHSVRSIAKARRMTWRINETIDRWATSTSDDRMAVELARLDEVQVTFYARA